MFVLCLETGEYSDKIVSIVGVFDTIELAQAAVDASTKDYGGFYFAAVLPNKNMEYDCYDVEKIYMQTSDKQLTVNRATADPTLVAYEEFFQAQTGRDRCPNDISIWLLNGHHGQAGELVTE